MPLGSFKGIMAAELAFVPGIQLPHKIEVGLVFQYFYGGGNIAQYSGDVPSIPMNFSSMGGGLRVDRAFWFTPNLGIAPFFGLAMHYQNFYRSADAGGGAELVTAAIAPEIGAHQYFRFGPEGFRFFLGAVGGMFIYSGQNMTYARVTLGAEYAYY